MSSWKRIYALIAFCAFLALLIHRPAQIAQAWPPTGTADLQIVEQLGEDIAPTACTGYTYLAGWNCRPATGGGKGFVFDREASASNLTFTPTTMTVTPGTTYKVTYTSTITAGTMTTTLGGILGASRSSTTDTAASVTEYFTAGTSGKLIFTAVSTTVATITEIYVKPVTSIMSSNYGPVAIKAALSNARNQAGVDISISGTKSGGAMDALVINDNGSGGTRKVLKVTNVGTETASITSAGVATVTGIVNSGSMTATSSGFTLDASGNLDLLSCDVSGAATVGSTLGVTGASTLTGGVIVPTYFTVSATGNVDAAGYGRFAGIRDTATTFTAIASADLDLDADPFDYIEVQSGTAATITLPATIPAGKVYVIMHNNGTVATTITAAGGFSVNAAVDDTSLNAAGETMFLIGAGANGWSAMTSGF